jgi:SPT2 chromatin protein
MLRMDVTGTDTLNKTSLLAKGIKTPGTVQRDKPPNIGASATEKRPVTAISAGHKKPSSVIPSTEKRPNSSSSNTEKKLVPVPSQPKKLLTAPNAASAIAVAPSNAPAKGSFAEIMARAKQNQTTAKDFRIVHKKSEKMARKETVKDAKKPVVSSKDAAKAQTLGKSGKPDKPAARPAAPTSTMTKKRPESGYQGTSRKLPSTNTYKGTASLKAPTRPEPSRKPDRQRLPSYDEEEDENSYYSDASSDMEAGAYDIAMEEELALREARREDLIALREEEELKKRKLARKMGR